MCEKLDTEKRDCKSDGFVDQAICEGLGCCWDEADNPDIPYCFCVFSHFDFIYEIRCMND